MLQVTSPSFQAVGPGQTSAAQAGFKSPAAASYTAAITDDPHGIFEVTEISAVRPTVVYQQTGDPSDGVKRGPPTKVVVNVPIGSSNGATPLRVLSGDILTVTLQMTCPSDPEDSYSATLVITSSNAGDTTAVPLTATTGLVIVKVVNSAATAAPGAQARWTLQLQSVAGPGTTLTFAPELSAGSAPPTSLVSIPAVSAAVARRGQATVTITATVGTVTPPGTYSFFVAETAFGDTWSPFSLSLVVSNPPVSVTSAQPSAFSMAVGTEVDFAIDVQLTGAGTPVNLSLDPPMPGMNCTFLDAQGNPIPSWSVPLTAREGMQFPVRLTLPTQSAAVEPLSFSWSAYGGAEQGKLNFSVTIVPQSKTFTATIDTPAGTALGGSLALTLRSDGTFVFSGHMHDSGFDPYDFRLRALVTTPDYAVAAQITGHTDGTGSNLLGSVNRNFDWNQTGTNPAIQMYWGDVQQGVLTTFFSYEDVGLLHVVEDLARDFVSFLATVYLAGGTVAAVIAIGSELTSLAGASAGPGGLVGVVVAGGTCMVWGPIALIPAVVAGVAAGAITNALINSRALSASEYQFAQQVFGDTLPAADTIILTNLSGLNGRSFTIPNAAGTILVNIGIGFSDPMNYVTGSYTRPGQVLIHELTHAWQINYRTFTPGLICEAVVNQVQYLLGTDVYAYGPPGPPFSHFDVEAQGAIVDQWFGGTGSNVPGRTPANPNDPYFMYIANYIRLGQT